MKKSERSAREAEARALDPGAWVPPDTPDKAARRRAARNTAEVQAPKGGVRADTGEPPSGQVRAIISEAMCAVALDGVDIAKSEKWLHEKLRPYLIKAAR